MAEKVGQTITTSFSIFESDGYTKASNRATACTAYLYANGTTTAESVNIEEMNNAGDYVASFVPASKAKYKLHVFSDYDDRWWLEEWSVETADIDDTGWSYILENGKTALEFMRIMFSILRGKSSGGGTNTLVFRDDADTKDRHTETVDSNGNRTAVASDGS